MAANRVVIRGPVVDEWTKAFNQISKGLKDLNSLLDKTNGQIKSLDAAFNVTKHFQIFVDIAKKLNEVESVKFKNIAEGIKLVAQALKSITTIKPEKLLALPATLDNLIKSIKNVPSTEKIKSLFEDFRKLANLQPANIDASRLVPIANLDKIVSGLEKFNQIDGKTIRNAVKIFAQASTLFKLVSAAIRFVPGGKQLDTLSKSFSRVGDALDSFRRLANFKLDKARLVNLGKSLVAFVLSIRGVARFSGNPEKIRAVAILVREIQALFKLIPGTKVITIDDVKDFKAKVDILVKSLKGFRGLGNVKIPNLTGSLRGMFNTLSGEVGRGGQQIREGFLDKIGRGFSEQIGRTLFDSISRGVHDVISGQGLRDLGDQLGQAGQTLLQGFGLGKLTQSQGFGLALDFDDISKQISVFASNIPIEEAQEFANVIGIQYPLSANNALSAILDLAKAGQEFGDIRNILPSAADLASLSESGDLDKVTKFLIGAEAGFNQFAQGVQGTFDNVDVASNIVFKAANVSTASVDGMIDALNIAAPIANRFNLTMEQTAATLTLFEDANIRGAQAGNLFATVMGELAKPRARKELERLGVAWQNSDGTLRNNLDVLEDVRAKYEELNLTQVEVSNSLAALGGDKFGQQGLSIIFGRGGINDVLGAMGDVTDATQGANVAAQKLLESLRGQITQLQGSWETLLTDIFLPMLDRFFLPVVKAARAFVDFMLQAPPVFREFISNFIVLASAAATFVGAFAVGSGALIKFAGVLQGVLFHVARMAILLPATIFQIGAFATSLLGAVAVIGVFVTAALALNAIFTGIVHAIENNVGGLVDKAIQVEEAFTSILDEISRIANITTKALALLFDRAFGRDTGSAIDFVAQALQTIKVVLQQINQVLANISLEDIAFTVFFFGRQLEFTLSALNDFASGLIKIFQGDITGGFDLIGQGFTKLKNLVLSTIEVIFGRDVLARVFGFFNVFRLDRLFEAFNQLKRLGGSAVETITKGLAALSAEFAKFGKGVERIWNLINEFFRGSIQLNELFSGIGAELATFLGKVGSAVIAVGQLILDGVAALLFDVAPRIAEFIGNVLSSIGRELRKIPLLIAQVGRDIGSQVLEEFGLALFRGDWATIGRQVVTAIFEAIAIAIQELGSLGKFLIDKLFPAGDTQEQVAKQFDFSVLVNTLVSVFSTIGAVVSAAFEGIKTVVRNIFFEIGATLTSLGHKMGSEFLIALGDSFRTGDILGIFLNLVDSFLAGVQFFIGRIPVYVQIIGNTIGSELILTLGQALADASRWDRVATLIIQGIRNGIANLTEFIANIGAFILNSIFKGPAAEQTGEDVGSRIVRRIFEIITTVFNRRALTRIFGAAVRIFASLVSEVLNLPGRLLTQIATQIENSGLRSVILAVANVFTLLAGPVTYVAGVLFRFVGIIADIAINLLDIVVAGSKFERMVVALGAAIAFAVSQGLTLQTVFLGILKFVTNIPVFLNVAITSLKAFAVQFAGIAVTVAGVVSVIIILQSVLKNLSTLADGNILKGLGDIFFDIGASVLRLVGVSEEAISGAKFMFDFIIASFENLARQLGSTIQRIVNFVAREFNKILDTVLGREQFTANAEAVITPSLDSSLQGTGLASIGEEFGRVVATGNQEQIDAFTRVLFSENNKILDEFLRLSSSGKLQFLSEDDFENVVRTLAGSGNIQEVFARMPQDPEGILRIMNTLIDVDLDAATQSVNQFVREIGRVPLSNEQMIETVATLDRLLEAGIITQDRYNRILGETFGLSEDATAVLDEQGNVITEVTRNWEEMDEAIAGVSENLGQSVNEFADWISSAENAEEQSKRLQELYTQLFDLVDFGVIGRQDADTYFDTVLQQMGIRRQSERDQLNPFRGAVSDQLFEADFAPNVNAPDPEDVFQDPEYLAYLKELEEQLAQDTADIGVDVGVSPRVQAAPGEEPTPFLGPSPEEAKEQAEEVEKLNERFVKKEKDITDRIGDIRRDGERNIQKLERDARKKRIRDAEDHQKRLREISKSGSDTIIDAVASRDSAAAQAAVKRAATEKRKEDEKFRLDQQRAAEDLRDRKAEAQERTRLRIQEQHERLNELRLEHQQELTELRNKHQQAIDAERAATQQQIAEMQNRSQQMQTETRSLWDKISSILTAGLSTLANSSNSFVSKLGTAGQSLLSTGTSLFSGIRNGVNNALGRGASTRGGGGFLNRLSGVGGGIGRAASGASSFLNRVSSFRQQTSSGRTTRSNIPRGATSRDEEDRGILQEVQRIGTGVTGLVSGLFGGRRQFGGPTRFGQFFEVSEREPELYREGDRLYLIPSRNGQVIPPRANPRVGGVAGGGFNFTFTIENITIEGGGNVSEKLLQEIESVVVPQLTERVRRVAATRHGNQV